MNAIIDFSIHLIVFAVTLVPCAVLTTYIACYSLIGWWSGSFHFAKIRELIGGCVALWVLSALTFYIFVNSCIRICS